MGSIPLRCGRPHYEHLRCTRIQPHRDNRVPLIRLLPAPDEYGAGEIPLRLDRMKGDDRRRLDRTENLRAIPEGSAKADADRWSI